MERPLISVIVPIYNMEKCLSYCVNSLLRQTYTNLEILLIDDGSKDGSLKLCYEYAAKDDRCKVYHQKNGGIGSARNLGLKHATGEYISFVDSDDYVDSSFIETLYSGIISGDYDISMVGYEKCYNYHSENQQEEGDIYVMPQSDLINSLYNWIPCRLTGWTDILFLVVWNKLYKRSLLKNLSFTFGTLSEDLEFNNQVFLRSSKAVLNDAKLYHYYQRVDSAVHKSIDKNYIRRLFSHYNCLNAIPENQQRFRAACMCKLYKTLLSTRYIMRNFCHKKDRKEINHIICQLKEKTFKEMLHTPYISKKLKFLFFIFYKIPVTYSLFVSYCELKAKLDGDVTIYGELP